MLRIILKDGTSIHIKGELNEIQTVLNSDKFIKVENANTGNMELIASNFIKIVRVSSKGA